MSAVVYIRVSSKKQSKFNESTSLDSQEENCFLYAKKHLNLNLIQNDTYEEIGSAFNDSRIMFKKMIRYVSNEYNKIKFILINDVSRFHRNLRLGLNILDKLESKGVTVISVTEDCSYGPNVKRKDKIRFRNKLVNAEDESIKISDRVLNSINYRIKRGDFIGKAPFGYKAIKDKRGVRVLINNYSERNILNIIGKLLYENKSNEQIVAYLNKFKLKNRNKDWTISSLSYYIAKEKLKKLNLKKIIKSLPKIEQTNYNKKRKYNFRNKIKKKLKNDMEIEINEDINKNNYYSELHDAEFQIEFNNLKKKYKVYKKL